MHQSLIVFFIAHTSLFWALVNVSQSACGSRFWTEIKIWMKKKIPGWCVVEDLYSLLAVHYWTLTSVISNLECCLTEMNMVTAKHVDIV